MRKAIKTDKAPSAIGCYSQAILTEKTLYLSGQIPLDPKTMNLVTTGIEAEVKQVFDNMKEVILAAHASLDQVVKLTVYLIDLAHIKFVNDAIAAYFNEPFPARTSIQVSALPKGAAVEIEAIVVMN